MGGVVWCHVWGEWRWRRHLPTLMEPYLPPPSSLPYLPLLSLLVHPHQHHLAIVMWKTEEKRILLMLENVTMIILLPFVVYTTHHLQKWEALFLSWEPGSSVKLTKNPGIMSTNSRTEGYTSSDKTQYKNLHSLLFYFLNYSHDPLNVIHYQLQSDSNWTQNIYEDRMGRLSLSASLPSAPFKGSFTIFFIFGQDSYFG